MDPAQGRVAARRWVTGVSGDTAADPPPTRWVLTLTLAWLGLWIAQFAPLQVLLPGLTSRVVTSTSWIRVVLVFGVVAGVAGGVAAVVVPRVGRSLDRADGSGSGHRAWFATAVGVCVVGLVALGLQTTVVGATLAWSVALLGQCAAGVVLTTALARHVPPRYQATVSTAVAVANAAGVVLGTALAGASGDDFARGGALLALAVLVTCLPFALTRPPPRVDTVTTAAAPDGSGPGPATRSRRPLRVAFTARSLLTLGNALGTTLLLFFFTYDLHLPDAETFLVEVVVVYVVATVLTAAVCGPLSDLLQARRVFLVAAGVLQAGAALVLALSPTRTDVVTAAVVIGVGWGAFMAVDQAVVATVTDGVEGRGRDVAVLGVASSLPQNLGPLLASLVVAAAGGFAPLFLVAAVVVLTGGAAAVALPRGPGRVRRAGAPVATSRPGR